MVDFPRNLRKKEKRQKEKDAAVEIFVQMLSILRAVCIVILDIITKAKPEEKEGKLFTFCSEVNRILAGKNPEKILEFPFDQYVIPDEISPEKRLQETVEKLNESQVSSENLEVALEQ